VEVELLQDLIDQNRLFDILVYAIEGAASSLHRQCWDLESLVVGRDGRNARRDAKTNVVEATQLLHHLVYLPSPWSLRIENEFGVIEKQDHVR